MRRGNKRLFLLHPKTGIYASGPFTNASPAATVRQRIARLFITASDEVDVREQALAEGAVAY
jgi:hypothetical protein